MKVLIVGAGGQGGPCSSILARDHTVEEIRLADLDITTANQVALKVGSPKIKTSQVDATDCDAVAQLAKGTDLIIDLVLPWMAGSVMQAALKAGASYVNTAYDTPFWEEIVAGKPLSFDKEFKEKGLTALLGCGMAPGFINVLIRKQCDALDAVDSIKIRLAKSKSGAGKYDEITRPWDPGWAPIQALKDCADRAVCFEGGTYSYMEPYSGMEEWEFSSPVGTRLVSHHSHEEPYSLPGNIKKGIQYCDFKYYVSYHPAALVSLGLASFEEVEVKGVKVKPIDVVAAVLPKAGNAFFSEDPEHFEYLDDHVFMSMMAEITGSKDGKKTVRVVECPKMTAPARPIYDLFGTSLVNVALPAAVGAKMVAGEVEKGVIFAEQLDADRFLAIMKDTGYPYQWKETVKEL